MSLQPYWSELKKVWEERNWRKYKQFLGGILLQKKKKEHKMGLQIK